MTLISEINKSELPTCKELTIGNVVLDVYYNKANKKYIFGINQIAEQFDATYKHGGRFFNSKRAESIYSNLSAVCGWGTKTFVLDKLGRVQEVFSIGITDLGLFIVDLVRFKNKKAQLVASALVVDSLRRRCDKLFDQQRAEAEYQAEDSILLANLNARSDCNLHTFADLKTCREIAEYLGYECNRTNSHALASHMAVAFPGGDKAMGRRLYDAGCPKVRDAIKLFFEAEALRKIEFDKQLRTDPFRELSDGDAFADL